MPKLDLSHPPKDVPVPSAIGLPHPPSSEPKIVRRKIGEQELLNLIRNSGGILDVSLVAAEYGVDKEEVLGILNNLARKGLIALEA
ncbi:MAG: cell division protein, partial [Metallosphaera sp.]